MLFFFDQWLYIRKDEYCKKSSLSNTFADVVNHLSLGKSKFGRCSINNNAEFLKGSETVSSRSSTSSSSSNNCNNYFTDQPVIPTSKRFKDSLQEPKNKKIKKKLNSKIWELLNIISSLEKMILLNQTL